MHPDKAFPRRSPRARVTMMAVATSVGALLVAGCADSRPGGDVSAEATPNDVEETQAPPVRAMDPAVTPEPAPLEASTGWMAYGVTEQLEPMGYIPTQDFFNPDLVLRPVHDAPGGALIGYASPYIPLIDRDVAEAPGFDLDEHARQELGPARYEALRAQVEDGAAPVDLGG